MHPIPVLYQSGYLTIKGYDPDFQIYTLAYPNNEVRKGFIVKIGVNFDSATRTIGQWKVVE